MEIAQHIVSGGANRPPPLIKNANALLNKQKQAEKSALLADFKAQAIKKGLSLAEVLNTRATRGKVAPKYRNPNDRSQTWTGRGRKPLWVVAALGKGIPLKKLKI